MEHKYSVDLGDIAAGVVLFVSGLAVAWYAINTYDLGVMTRMGPGMFPMALGFVLAGLGILIVIPALFQAGSKLEVRVWTPLFVLAGIGAFALIVRPFGMVPAIFGVVIISSFAELEVRPVSLALLSISLCVLAWLIFLVGLGIPVPLFRWSF